MTVLAAPRLVDIGVIVSMLADRVPALCAELLPAGAREGHHWRIGNLAGEPGRSMGVNLATGLWRDWGDGEKGGDALDLVAKVLFRGDKRRAIQWARAWLGLDSADPASFEQHRREVVKRREHAERDDMRRQRLAAGIFLAAQAQLAGTPAAVYLASRAIDLAQLGRQPRSLRFHPALWNEESQRHWPALVAAIVNLNGRIVAAHRTWLREDGSSKAPLRDPKMTLGRYVGGSIRLWRGASGKALKDASADDMLVVTEGIEDGLSVAVAAPEYRVIAAVSLSNMRNIALPPAVGIITIMAQNDAANSPAAAALDRAVEHFAGLGKRVRIARPPPEIKDANDLLRAGAGAA